MVIALFSSANPENHLDSFLCYENNNRDSFIYAAATRLGLDLNYDFYSLLHISIAGQFTDEALRVRAERRELSKQQSRFIN